MSCKLNKPQSQQIIPSIHTRVDEGGNPSTCFPCEEQASVSRETSPYIAPNKQMITTVYTREGLKMEFD